MVDIALKGEDYPESSSGLTLQIMTVRRFRLLVFLVLLNLAVSPCAWSQVLPAPKNVEVGEGRASVSAVALDVSGQTLASEQKHLVGILTKHGISTAPDGFPIRLRLGDAPIPEIVSRYADEIKQQAYTIRITADEATVMGQSPAAVFHALQTLDQLFEDRGLPIGEIVDWPDIPVRMLMIDPARQNENAWYYRRVIDFASRYKMNAILCHLTDDQTAALFHEDYPELMHPQAWTPDEVRDLVAYAKERHIDLIPEIESLGHSRMFTRKTDYAEYLHQTKTPRPDHRWTGTDLEGFTNVLCPASPQAAAYLEAMFDRTVETFNHSWLHIGCDEVDMTDCDRCLAEFGPQSDSDWIYSALDLQIRQVTQRGRKAVVWGDMLLQYPDVIDRLSPEETLIFDWHYKENVDDSSIVLFTEKGFEVVACPALVCYPHMILPDLHNYNNIARFTQIARQHDLQGVNTTIWIPTRYMSDVLWPGIAYAAEHAWSGSEWNENRFHSAFLDDHFGSQEGEAFLRNWKELASIVWHRDEFNTSCWIDEESLKAARSMATDRSEEIAAMIGDLDRIREQLSVVGSTITKNGTDWMAIERSAAILQFTMEHLLAAPKTGSGSDSDRGLIGELDEKCKRMIDWIEEDWTRNRYSGDPNMDGMFLDNQHLLHRFRSMHRFHQELLETSARQ